MRAIYKLLGAKYVITNSEGQHYFWRLATAKAYADNYPHREIVWTLDHAKVYDTRNQHRWGHVHYDANNFNPYQ